MAKPDWAERLQRTRKREYLKGWDDAHKHIIKLLKDNLDDDIETDEMYYQDLGIRLAINIVDKSKDGDEY